VSDWHFGCDYDMWLYPPVDWTSPDYDYELPEPIEAANIEGELLVNAKDAIEQVRRLQHENAKLRELVLYMWDFSCVVPDEPHTSKEELDYSVEVWKRMRELGVVSDGGVVSESYIRSAEEGSICPVPKASVIFDGQKFTFDSEDSERFAKLLERHLRKLAEVEVDDG